ncbi:hypothetical protein CORC01_10795 [Colletotrichum orchidophilum]|uniref:Uncharacterized protein n=1 Tax=Colletotrichum orchidophilum TaxID=1209926 RepID=A0A1G4AXP9_9PEZI|nr:uncharacterized protein CORC01_10795 [Colletotrichum orchidophilum]OHE93896.1 hypothetical protein CORC01_10795 [Colletotrichum orchidophilum]
METEDRDGHAIEVVSLLRDEVSMWRRGQPGRPRLRISEPATTYGLRVFALLHRIQTAIVGFVNRDGQLLHMAHIYNSLEVSHKDLPPWQDMKDVIRLQEKPIFAGDPARKINTCKTRLSLAQGLKMSESSKVPPKNSLKDPETRRETALFVFQRKFGRIIDEKDFAEARCTWVRDRNSPGFRRELVPTPVLDEQDFQMSIGNGWRLTLGDKTVRGAVRDRLRSSKAVSGHPCLNLDELETVIRREVPVLVFDFESVRRSGKSIFPDWNNISIGDATQFLDPPAAVVLLLQHRSMLCQGSERVWITVVLMTTRSATL